MSKTLTSLCTVSGELTTETDMTLYLKRFKKATSLDNAVEGIARRNNIVVNMGSLKSALDEATSRKLSPVIIKFFDCALKRRLEITMEASIVVAKETTAYNPVDFFDFSKLNKG